MIENLQHRFSALLVIALVAGLEGCSTLDSLPWGKASPTTGTSGETATGIYYTGEADLPLYENPGTVVITRLPQYTKVHRKHLQNHYAQVRVDATGKEGWVDNGKLVWRLPDHTSQPQAPATEHLAAPAATPPAVESPESVSPPAQQAVNPPASPPAASSSNLPEKATVAPSIFNPY